MAREARKHSESGIYHIMLRGVNDQAKTDEEAREQMAVNTGCGSVSDFQKLTKAEREACIRQMYQEGFHIAQLGRITGYSRQAIYRAIVK